MTFAHPWVLALLILPAALAAWEGLRRGRRVRLPFDHSGARRGAWLARVLLAANLLPAAILGAVITIIAGPQTLGPPGQERILTNIEIVLDVSGSMSSPVASGGSRYTTSMAAIQEFTSRRKGDAFGLTIFGGEVVRWVPLTKDLSAIRNATPFLDPATMPSHLNSTRIGNALRFSAATLSHEPQGDKAIILITDGFSSDLDGGVAATIGGELRDQGIVLYGINVCDEPAPAQMSEVVNPTGGQVYSARDKSSLAAVFDHIDHMQPMKIKPKQPEPIDHFFPVVVAALACASLHFLCLWGMRYTPW